MRRHSLIPWLAKCDQELVHPNAVFDTDQQKAHIRDWLAGRVDFDLSFDIHFYPADTPSTKEVLFQLAMSPSMFQKKRRMWLFWRARAPDLVSPRHALDG